MSQEANGLLRFGSHGSIEVNTKEGWFSDYETKVSGGVLELIQHKAGVSDRAGAFKWLEAKGIKKPSEKVAAFYDYRDEAGEILYRVERKTQGADRAFFQHGPNGKGGFHAVKGVMKDIRRVLYRLPALIAADQAEIVYVCEGEKDADRLAKAGLVATSNSGGAGEFRPEFAPFLTGRRVVILEDNDDPGRAHAADVLAKLSGVVDQVAILSFPNLHKKGDVSDWLDAGGTIAELRRLALMELDCEASDSNSQTKPGVFAVEGQNSEDSLAREWVANNCRDWRYDHGIERWFNWTGVRWRMDSTKSALQAIREHVRIASETVLNGKGKASPGQAKVTVTKGVETFSQIDPRIAVEHDVWDPDVFLLGTPDGVFDLRTGKNTGADRSAMITKSTSIAPKFEPPKRFLQFLREITNNDDEMAHFLKLAFGYCLTGSTREHALFFGYGGGKNGKSVLLNSASRIMGDYATTAAMDTFTASKGDKHPTDLARLDGARLVAASETEEGRAWAEARIKQLTGGDRIAARFMRQDFFEFVPRFKLFIVGNFRPRLHNVDEATRRRFNIIPFLHVPPIPDPDLEEKLACEHPQILAWMIVGAREWFQDGLTRPAAIVDATDRYFEDQDMLGQWLAERCFQRVGAMGRAGELYQSWCEFAVENGEEKGTQKAFAEVIQKRFVRDRVNQLGRIYRGVDLLRNQKTAETR